MTWYTILGISLLVTLLAVGAILTVVYGCKRILIPAWHKNQILKYRIDISELFITINFIIKVECRLFEQYFENNTTAEFTTLTNSEFTNIYNELSMRCLRAVSETLWQLGEIYMDRTELQTYITQEVMNFLLERSTVTEDEESETPEN